MPRKPGLTLIALALVLLVAACDSGPSLTPAPTVPPPLPTHVPGGLAVELVQDLGVLGNPPSVRTRDGGISAFIGSNVLWLFGDTILTKPDEQGLSSISNSASLALITTPFVISPTDTINLDTTGAPLPFLPYNQEELDYNKTHGDKDDDRYALWPSSVVRQRDGTGLIFYSKLLIEPGGLNFIGSGQAQIDRDATIATREPDLLFESPDPLFGQGALVSGSYLNIYACTPVSALDSECKIASAPVDNVIGRSVYTFWDGKDWVQDINKAAVVLHGPAGGLTVSWNPYIGSYLATYSDIASNKVFLRSAPAPEGPWSDPVEAFTGQTSSVQDRDYSAYEHPELARDGGKTIYITYYHPTAALEGEIRIVELKLK